MSATSISEIVGEDPRVARSRAKMLAAATDLLVESGLKGVTADAVSERSGVAKSTLYRHWTSVNELLIDVMRCNVPQSPTFDLAGGFEPSLRAWVSWSLQTLSTRDWARTLPALLELRTHSPEMAELLKADMENTLTMVASILALGAAEGRLPAGLDPRHVTRSVIGPLVLASLSGDDDLPELCSYVVERFLASYGIS